MDNITHYNMTEDEYVEYRAERAREEARNELKHNPYFIRPFSEILEKRDRDLVLQCLGAIENAEDYTAEEVEESKAEMAKLQAEFDALVEEMTKEKQNEHTEN